MFNVCDELCHLGDPNHVALSIFFLTTEDDEPVTQRS